MGYFTAATYFFAFRCAALLQAFISLSPNSSCRSRSLVAGFCFVHKTAGIKIEAYLLGPNVLWIIFYHATSKSKSAFQIIRDLKIYNATGSTTRFEFQLEKEP